MTALNRALGAFYGLALGDALGMPTQSLNRETIKTRFGTITDLQPNENVIDYPQKS